MMRMSQILIIIPFIEHGLYFRLYACHYENISTLLHNSGFIKRGKSGLGVEVKRFAQDHTAGHWRAGVGIQIQVRGQRPRGKNTVYICFFQSKSFLAGFWQIALQY